MRKTNNDDIRIFYSVDDLIFPFLSRNNTFFIEPNVNAIR